jgi:hypothetical protein
LFRLNNNRTDEQGTEERGTDEPIRKFSFNIQLFLVPLFNCSKAAGAQNKKAATDVSVATFAVGGGIVPLKSS